MLDREKGLFKAVSLEDHGTGLTNTVMLYYYIENVPSIFALVVAFLKKGFSHLKKPYIPFLAVFQTSVKFSNLL